MALNTWYTVIYYRHAIEIDRQNVLPLEVNGNSTDQTSKIAILQRAIQRSGRSKANFPSDCQDTSPAKEFTSSEV